VYRLTRCHARYGNFATINVALVDDSRTLLRVRFCDRLLDRLSGRGGCIVICLARVGLLGFFGLSDASLMFYEAACRVCRLSFMSIPDLAAFVVFLSRIRCSFVVHDDSFLSIMCVVGPFCSGVLQRGEDRVAASDRIVCVPMLFVLRAGYAVELFPQARQRAILNVFAARWPSRYLCGSGRCDFSHGPSYRLHASQPSSANRRCVNPSVSSAISGLVRSADSEHELVAIG